MKKNILRFPISFFLFLYLSASQQSFAVPTDPLNDPTFNPNRYYGQFSALFSDDYGDGQYRLNQDATNVIRKMVGDSYFSPDMWVEFYKLFLSNLQKHKNTPDAYLTTMQGFQPKDAERLAKQVSFIRAFFFFIAFDEFVATKPTTTQAYTFFQPVIMDPYYEGIFSSIVDTHPGHENEKKIRELVLKNLEWYFRIGAWGKGNNESALQTFERLQAFLNYPYRQVIYGKSYDYNAYLGSVLPILVLGLAENMDQPAWEVLVDVGRKESFKQVFEQLLTTKKNIIDQMRDPKKFTVDLGDVADLVELALNRDQNEIVRGRKLKDINAALIVRLSQLAVNMDTALPNGLFNNREKLAAYLVARSDFIRQVTGVTPNVGAVASNSQVKIFAGEYQFRFSQICLNLGNKMKSTLEHFSAD